MPGYTTLRSMAEQMGDLQENHGFKPALVEIEDALAPGFIVEDHAGGKCTVFIPLYADAHGRKHLILRHR